MKKCYTTLLLLCALPLLPITAAASTPATTADFQQVLQAAISHDPEYRAARHALEAERQEIPLARSQLLPSARLSAGISHERSDNIYTDEDSNFYDPTQPRSSGELDDTYWRISVTQPLFDRTRSNDLQRAKHQAAAAEHRYQHTRQQLIYRVSELWLNILYAEQRMHYTAETLQTLELRLEQAQREMQLGVGDELELLELGAQRDLAQADLLAARSELEEKKLEIQLITGQNFSPHPQWITGAHRLQVTQQPQPETYWIDQARGNRNYQEQTSRVAMAQATRYSSRAGHYPNLALNLNYTDRNSEDDQRTRQDLTVSLDMNLELYGGGRTSAAMRQSQARLQAEQAMADSSLLNARQTISMAWARQNNLYQRLNALQRSMTSAERYQQAAQRGQTLGLRSQVEVVEAAARLYETRQRHAEALTAYLLADLRLHFETGQLTETKLQEYDQLFYSLNP